MKVRPVGAEFVPCGPIDSYDDANGCFSQFRERA